MLVLTRRIGEKILLCNGQIEITVLYIRNGQVGLGIKEPTPIAVASKRRSTLILKRDIREPFFLYHRKIEVKVLYIRNGHFAIGIKAPSHIDIERKEIFLKKHRQVSRGDLQ